MITSIHPLRCRGSQLLTLFSHNFKTSLRNLLKYKVQNIISILCLAVGVVCFSITAQVMFNFARNTYYTNIDQGIAHFSLLDMPEKEAKETIKAGNDPSDLPVPLMGRFSERLLEHNLPAVKEIHARGNILVPDLTIDDGTGLPKTCIGFINYFSPNYLHYYCFRSAITGKRIPELQEGDLLITNVLSEQLFGKGVDPRGFTLQYYLDGSQRTISDVVNITERNEFDQEKSVIYIKKNPYEFGMMPYIPGLNIEVAEGYTHEQLREQLQSAFPEYCFLLQHRAVDWEQGIVIIMLILVVLLLGASVLIIGVMGFLKMELQLFSLRAREMALRRTMGAKPRHLFMLLSIEVLIVFALSAMGALVLTSFLADYALPIIHRLKKSFFFDVDLIMSIEMWVALVTFFFAVLVTLISVYRQLHAPVGLRVGRSHSTSTKGQGLMLGTQFVVSMFLCFVAFGLFYAFDVIQKKDSHGFQENRSLYKGVLLASQVVLDRKVPDFAQKLALNPDIENVAYCIRSFCLTQVEQRDESLVRNYYTMESQKVRNYHYSFLATNENLIDRFEIRITPNLPGDSTIHQYYCAIYVRTEQVDRLRKKWNLEVSHDVITRPLYKQRSYTLIGYAPCIIGYRGKSPEPSFWIVEEDISWHDLSDQSELNAYNPNAHYLIFPKAGKYNKVKDAITDIFREAQPGDMNEAPVQDLYDQWFKSYQMIEMMRQLCFLLVIVSILCIVASVYSAIALESRGRQKEVALRKIHGAHTRDIIMLFGRYYLRLLSISAIIVSIVSVGTIATIHSVGIIDSDIFKDLYILILYLILAILIVVAITLLTISHKIWKVSRINAAEVVNKN